MMKKSALSTLAFDDWPRDFEVQFWALYPRRVSKKPAMKALGKVKASGEVSWAKLVDSIARYTVWLGEASPTNWRPEPKHPATWLNGGCWDDELPAPVVAERSFFQQVYGPNDPPEPPTRRH